MNHAGAEAPAPLAHGDADEFIGVPPERAMGTPPTPTPTSAAIRQPVVATTWAPVAHGPHFCLPGVVVAAGVTSQQLFIVIGAGSQ